MKPGQPDYLRYTSPAPPQEHQATDGVLLVDKPTGPTSHDIVDAVRRHFGIRKVGHGGTLDPMATGLLILLIGRGTRLSEQFMGSDKTYEGTLRLGIATDSHDADGQTTAEQDPSGVTEADLADAVRSFTGDLFQVPPMVSAVKVDGVPLYKRARKGQVIERQPRFIHIYSFKLTRFAAPEADFVLRCTKGTYVRTLCHDIGQKLGCGAHLKALRRTRSGNLDIGDAAPLATVLTWSRSELETHIMPMRHFSRA